MIIRPTPPQRGTRRALVDPHTAPRGWDVDAALNGQEGGSLLDAGPVCGHDRGRQALDLLVIARDFVPSARRLSRPVSRAVSLW
ncbi:MAG: hypothetical protein R3F43_19140 [bacterium]